MPHFLAIAWMYRVDYARAGITMLPGIDPDGRRTSQQALLYSAALCAIANVEINAASLKDEGVRGEMLEELDSLKGRADQLLEQAQTAFKLRLSS